MSELPVFEALVEERIARAARDGAFDGLPGAGRPLVLDDDRFVPPELRMAYRILKNAGFLPPEVEALREIRAVEDLLRGLGDGIERSRAQRRLQALRLRLSLSGRGAGTVLAEAAYGQRLMERMAGVAE